MNYLYVILFLIIALSFFIIFSKSTIVSLLCLVGVFFLSGFVFLLLGAEFLALTLILVYGGAISILFLFIIMMLNLRLVEVYNVNLYYAPFYAFINILFFSMLFFFFENTSSSFHFLLWDFPRPLRPFSAISLINYKSNLYVLGIALYNYFYFYVLIAAIILFVAMIGSIYLTLGTRQKRQIGGVNQKPLVSSFSSWKIEK